jgi:hypothetical protein
MAQAADIILMPDVGTDTLWYRKITPEDVVGIGKSPFSGKQDSILTSH